MVIQTQNSTYIVEWMPALPGKAPRWVADKFRKTPTAEVVRYARAYPFEGNTLTLEIGERMVLAYRG